MDYRRLPEETTHLSIIVPAYDELPNLRELIPRILTTVEELDGIQAEILIVLPSTAAAWELQEIRDLGAKAVVRQPGDSFGDAIRSGIASVSTESSYVITMDADGSHDPSTIRRLMEARNGVDVVVASRYTSGGTTDNSLLLRVMSRLLNWSYGAVLGIKCRDVSTSYKLYVRRDLEQLKLSCRDFDIVEEILFGLKLLHGESFAVHEIPDHFYPRIHGETKRHLGPFIVAYLATLIRLQWNYHRNSVEDSRRRPT